MADKIYTEAQEARMRQNAEDMKWAIEKGALGTCSDNTRATAAMGNMNNAGTLAQAANPNKTFDRIARDINRTMDNLLITVVARELDEHLGQHREHYGRGGWFNPTVCSRGDLAESLRHAVLSDDYLSVIAYASFLYMRNKLGLDRLNKKPISE